MASISVTPPQLPVSTTQVGTHPVRSGTACKWSESTALAGTHNPVDTDPRTRPVLFLNREPAFCVWSNLVNPNLTGSVAMTQLTAISCVVDTVSLFLSGIKDRPASTPPILLRRPVESSLQLFFKKPVIMSHTSLSSSLHALATRTHIAQQGHLRARPVVFAFKENSTSLGSWGMVPLVV